MTFNRKTRYFVLLVTTLTKKYTRFIAFGFFVGFVSSLLFLQLEPLFSTLWFTPIQRIGVVGEFTPSTLPRIIQQKISLGLTTIDPNGSPLPALAQSWEATQSGKSSLYTFHLRTDVPWQNGKPILASDINYNIRSVQFTVLDPHTLRATLTSPYSPFPTLLAKPVFLAGFKGLGPYRVQAIRLNGDKVVRLQLIALQGHVLPSLEYDFYKTEALAQVAFELGEIDTLEELGSVGTLASWTNVEKQEHTKYTQIVTLFFNLRHDQLKEKGFRQGLAYALPEFPFERAVSPISKTSWAYTDKVRIYKPDPTQAKKLLTNSPIASQSAQLTITTLAPYVDVAQAIANSWTSFGLKTSVKVENTVPTDFQILLAAQELPPDPDQYPFWHSTQSQTNITGYDTNVKIDKLLEDGRQELDQGKRKLIYADFQRRLVEDAPAIFLYYPTVYTLRRLHK